MARWILASGQMVIDREPSHIHVGVTDELLAEVFLALGVGDEERIKYTHQFGRVVGVSVRVKTSTGDTIVFAQRVHRDGMSRFVKNRAPESTDQLTVTLRRMPDGQYELRTAYLGSAGHAEPWATMGTDRYESAKTFWNAQALCWGLEPIVPGTETDECPW